MSLKYEPSSEPLHPDAGGVRVHAFLRRAARQVRYLVLSCDVLVTTDDNLSVAVTEVDGAGTKLSTFPLVKLTA